MWTFSDSASRSSHLVAAEAVLEYWPRFRSYYVPDPLFLPSPLPWIWPHCFFLHVCILIKYFISRKPHACVVHSYILIFDRIRKLSSTQFTLLFSFWFYDFQLVSRESNRTDDTKKTNKKTRRNPTDEVVVYTSKSTETETRKNYIYPIIYSYHTIYITIPAGGVVFGLSVAAAVRWPRLIFWLPGFPKQIPMILVYRHREWYTATEQVDITGIGC